MSTYRNIACTSRRRALALALALLLAASTALPAADLIPGAGTSRAYAVETEPAADDSFEPVTDGGNAEKYLEQLGGETTEADADSAANANADARGHWVYADIEGSTTREEQVAPSQPGTAIAAAAVALSGYGWAGSKIGPTSASESKRRHTRPPDNASYGNWSVYNQVQRAIPNNGLFTDCSNSVALAVRWSGVDDGYSDSSTLSQYRYMMKSPKWTRIGGTGRYWNRRKGVGDAGVNVQPGDVLVGKPCETEGRRTHIIIYTGTEAAKLKFPNADYSIFESQKGRGWTGMRAINPPYTGTYEYCVFRRNYNDLNIQGSAYAGLLLDEKVKYSTEIGLVEEKRTERVAVKYVYEEYALAAEGLPAGASWAAPASFKYTTPTFALPDPLLPAGYVFEGWYTSPTVGARITQVPEGTMKDVKVYAHVQVDAVHQLETYKDVERPPEAFNPLAALAALGAPWAALLAALAALAAGLGAAVALRARKARANLWRTW